MSVNIIIPMKDAGEAKSRLRAALATRERIALVHYLYRQTLAFFSTSFPQYHLSVVTPSAASAAIASRYGASVICEPAAAGLSAAAATAAVWSRRHGFDTQLLIPADIATLDRDEIARLLQAGGYLSPGVVICSARDGGTNALLTTPPDAIPFHFGHLSSEAHQAAAAAQSIACQILALEHLSRDVDTPADCAELVAMDVITHRRTEVRV